MYIYEACRKLGLQCFFRPIIRVDSEREEGLPRRTWVGRNFCYHQGEEVPEGEDLYDELPGM